MKSYEELKSDFSYLSDWEDRYRYLLDLGRQLPPLDEEKKTEEALVAGCQSRVWLVANVSEIPPFLAFEADSDAKLLRGLIHILLILVAGRSPQELLSTPIERDFEDLGLSSHLSPHRRTGFFSMVGRIREAARRWVSREKGG